VIRGHDNCVQFIRQFKNGDEMLAERESLKEKIIFVINLLAGIYKWLNLPESIRYWHMIFHGKAFCDEKRKKS